MKDQMANSNEVFKCFLGDFSAWFCSVSQTVLKKKSLKIAFYYYFF